MLRAETTSLWMAQRMEPSQTQECSPRTDNTGTFVSGTFNNTGAVQMTAAGNNVELVMNGPVTLEGGGSITMTETSGGVTLINQEGAGTLTNVNNLIQGSGQIGNNGLALTNRAAGVINANAARALLINSNTVLNQGALEATAGGTLQFQTSVVNQGTTILSSGTNSTVQFYNGTTILGGTISATAGGILGVVSGNNVTLDGSSHGALTISGIFTAPDNTGTFVSRNFK